MPGLAKLCERPCTCIDGGRLLTDSKQPIRVLLRLGLRFIPSGEYVLHQAKNESASRRVRPFGIRVRNAITVRISVRIGGGPSPRMPALCIRGSKFGVIAGHGTPLGSACCRHAASRSFSQSAPLELVRAQTASQGTMQWRVAVLLLSVMPWSGWPEASASSTRRKAELVTMADGDATADVIQLTLENRFFNASEMNFEDVPMRCSRCI